MKKIFTLLAATFLSIALFAADRKPSVTLKSNGNYEIVIDGKTIRTDYASTIDLGKMRDGRHTITVYQVVTQGFFRKARKMMSTSAFVVRNNDIKIKVDAFGKIQVTEKQNGRFNDNRGWEEMERHDRNDRGGRF